MSRRLLIIDDEETLVSSLKTFLTIKGYEVAVATNGRDGIRLLGEFSPELLLLDLNLSEGITGLDVLKKTKSIKPELKIVVLTGFGDEEDVAEECLRLGAVKFLCKPLSGHQIAETLDSI